MEPQFCENSEYVRRIHIGLQTVPFTRDLGEIANAYPNQTCNFEAYRVNYGPKNII